MRVAMKLWSVATGAIVLGILTGCAVDDPLVHVGACVAASSGGQLAGLDTECDLGRRTYLIVLPRKATTSDLRELGLSKEIVFALSEGTTLTGPRWCSVTTTEGGLPTHGGSGGVLVNCIESSVEIERPTLLEAEVVRIQMEQRVGEPPRVTNVRAVQRR